ncbi:MAG: SGNH/GDSL hydrolase family protein [Lachnospiraceae bacterium]|nr:SGNH/GDSL hydrolase family protein [Lachnospiraceae bacterium]
MKRRELGKIIIELLVFFAALAAGFLLGRSFEHRLQNAEAKTGEPENTGNAGIAGNTELDRLRAENEALKNGPRGFYQKLRSGGDVKILIVGDSIGCSMGVSEENSWEALLKDQLTHDWYGQFTFKNISLGGNTSYAGYVSVMDSDDNEEYDLAILCYGENDSTSGFSREYEAIIRALYRKYRHCSLIAILESSQKEETEKIKKIRELSEHYGFPCADTIAAFRDSGEAYENLSTDGVHPNEAGYRLYAETLNRIISDGADAYRPEDSADAEPLNSGMEEYEHCYFVDVSQGKRTGDTTWEFPFYGTIEAFPGIDRELFPGNTALTVFVDGKEEIRLEDGWDEDYSMRVISRLSDVSLRVTQNVTLVFEEPSQAEGLRKLVFTGV